MQTPCTRLPRPCAAILSLGLLLSAACGGGNSSLRSGPTSSSSYGEARAEGYAAADSSPVPVASERPARGPMPPPPPSPSGAPVGATPYYEPPAQREQERPGLGTVFGEERFSPVRDVEFERQGAPAFVATLHYNDHRGVEAMRARAQAFVSCRPGEPLFRRYQGDGSALFGGVTVQVVDEGGAGLPAYHVGDRVLVVGEAGRRYALLIENRTAQRLEIVASIDGLDVIDGKAASLDKRGYVVPAHGRLLIDGYRRTMDQMAAFRFGSVRDSYAGKTAEFGDRHVGVIGVALFTESGVDWSALLREAERRESADPFPGRFAQPPAY